MISTQNKKVILCLLVFLSIFLITFRFTETPKVWGDEGVFTDVARNIAVHGVVGLQTAPGEYFSLRNLLLTAGYPVIFPVAASFYFFGVGIVQARFPMLLYMFLLVLVFFIFNKKRFGFLEAVLSTLLLISFAPFYGNGRPVQGEVPGVTLFIIGLYFLLAYEQKGFASKKLAFFSGLFLALSCATKPLFLIGIPFALCVSCLFFIRRIKERKSLGSFFLGFLIPIFGYVYLHFPKLSDLKNSISTFLYFGGNHGSNISLFHTITTNVLRFFTESTPILFALLFGFIVCSAGYIVYKKEFQKFTVTDGVIFFFIFFNLIAYIFGTGWYRYFFPSHILVYLLFPGVFLYMISLLPKQTYRNILMLLPLFLIGIQFVQLAFFSQTPLVAVQERNSQFNTVLSNVPISSKVLFYNSIEGAVFLTSENYSQYLSMENFLVAGKKDSLQDPSFDYIIAGVDPDTQDFQPKCYTREEFSQYIVFTKQPGCKR